MPSQSRPGRALSALASVAVFAALAACGATAAHSGSARPTPEPIAGTAARAACDLVASPAGRRGAPGTVAHPLRTPQQLADRLHPGQTGCLRAGSYGTGPYGYALRVNHGGRPHRPIRMRSFPGERAVLTDTVVVAKGSDHVQLSRLDVHDANRSSQITVQVDARDTRLDHLDVTNNGTKTCVILGSVHGWGVARRTVVRDSVFRACGRPIRSLQDHAFYVANARRARILDNVILRASGYGVHLYPNARRTLVRGNVIDQSGGGVIFAGEGDLASSRNLVEGNVIANSQIDHNLNVYWGGRTGRGNVARGNCLWPGGGGNVERGPGLRVKGNWTADPDFVDAAAGDLRLAAGSACAKFLGPSPAVTAVSALAAAGAPAPSP